VTADVAKGRLAFPLWVGAVSTIPLVLLIAGALVDWDNMDRWPILVAWGWGIVGGFAYVMSYLLSGWFCIVGFRARLPWIWIWPVVFFFFVPFANIVFWALYRER
jgi:hypothetical protein